MIRRSLIISPLVALLLLAVGCSNDKSTSPTLNPVGLAVTFKGMAPDTGRLLTARVVDRSNLNVVADTSIMSLSSDSIRVNFGNVLQPGHSYNVDFFSDLNMNGRFDSIPVDHAWRIILNNVMHSVDTTFIRDSHYVNINMPDTAKLKLTMRFAGFTEHIGQLMAINVVDSMGHSLAADTTIAAIPGDSFAVLVARALIPNRSYQVNFFADLSRNDSLNPPPVDHVWRVSIAKLTKDTVITFVHNTNFTPVDSIKIRRHPLTMRFTGWTPDTGLTMHLLVVDSLYDTLIKDTVLARVPGDTFSVRIDTVLVNNKTYFADIWTDVNRNGSYDSIPADHSWHVRLPKTAKDTSVAVGYTSQFVNIRIRTR